MYNFDNKTMDKKYISWKLINDLLSKYYHVILLISLFSYFVVNFMAGVIKGGRWDLYQHIAMADRFLEGGGFYYSAVEASTPYFPGVAFLSVVIGKLFNPWRDYILLAIASLIGTAFLYVLIKIGEDLCGNKVISLSATLGIIYMGFQTYKSYMNEFKADSAILLIAVFLVYILDNYERTMKKINIKSLLFLFILALMMDLTKQQALYVDVALGLYVVFTNKFSLLDKIKILSSLVSAGIISLTIIFSIPNIEINTIQNLANMPYWYMSEIITQMGEVFLNHILFFALLFVFAILVIMRKIELTTLAKKWLLIAVLFGGAQILGGWKIGGNAGNYEVGMVTFLPFVVWATEYILGKCVRKQQIKNVESICYILLLFLSIRALICDGYFKIPDLVSKINTDKEVSSYLSDRLNDETIMYYSDQYMQIARSTVKPGMDVLSVPMYLEEYKYTKEEYIENQVYKYIYIREGNLRTWDSRANERWGYESNLVEALKEYYEVVDELDMPESLRGELYIVKEKN